MPDHHHHPYADSNPDLISSLEIEYPRSVSSYLTSTATTTWKGLHRRRQEELDIVLDEPTPTQEKRSIHSDYKNVSNYKFYLGRIISSQHDRTWINLNDFGRRTSCRVSLSDQ
jgi:hypothetical protein